MNTKLITLTLLVILGLPAFAALPKDDKITEAAAAVCEECTAMQDNNDPWTQDARLKRQQLAGQLTGTTDPAAPKAKGPADASH